MRILIADDHALFRAGLRRLLADRHEVVAEAASGPAAVSEALAHEPDLTLLDVQMPEGGGIEAARRIRAARPAARILMVSALAPGRRVEEAVRAGASGWIPKSAAPEELLAAVAAVGAGDSYFAAEAARELAGAIAGRRSGPPGTAVLSEREREVLVWLALGHSSREIGRELGLSPRTVDAHRTNLMRKLGLRRIQHVVRYAIRAGLIAP